VSNHGRAPRSDPTGAVRRRAGEGDPAILVIFDAGTLGWLDDPAFIVLLGEPGAP
jgi:hypothetical protein